MTPTNMTPYIIEERQLNISQLDVFQDWWWTESSS
jgi:ATP-dependent Clp protease protease subunit